MRPPKELLCERYRVLSLIGQGGMGSVWRGEHVSLGTPVAIKLLEPRLADSESNRARFLREARAAASLRGANVVHVLDHGVEGDTPFIVMELLRGESLGARLRREGTLAPEEVATIFAGVGRAMARAHKAGIVHRDLKPDNIFLAQDDDAAPIPKVVDFGIAKLLDPDALGDEVATHTGSMLGTPHYMSPEQARGRKDVDARMDLWAMTVIAFECLVGKRPFTADALGELVLRICSEPPPVPSAWGPVPPGFDAWFARGVDRTIERRYQTVEQLVTSLLDVLTPGRAVPSESGSRPVPPPAAETMAHDPTVPVEGLPSPAPSGTRGPASAATSPTAVPGPRAPRVARVAALGLVAVVGIGGIGWLVRGAPSSAPTDDRAPAEPSSTLAPVPSAAPPPRSPPAEDDPASVELRERLAREGWQMEGTARQGFTVRLDPGQPREGRPTIALVRTDDRAEAYGTWVRTFDAAPYVGKRVRLSGFTFTRGATVRADFWARVMAADSPGDGGGLGGKWHQLPPESGWTKREIVLEVPEGAAALNLGVGVQGPGVLWHDEVRVEVVGDDVPVSDHESDRTVGGWTLTGSVGSSPFGESGDAVHLVRRSEMGATVLQHADATRFVGRRAAVSIEVRAERMTGNPSCFLRAKRARYARESIETALKEVSHTTDGFVRCDLTVEVGPTARWLEVGVVVPAGSGELWIRPPKITSK